MTSLVELRILDGPNLYVPRPAVKVTVDARFLAELSEGDVLAVASSAGLKGSKPGAPGSDQRQRFLLRLMAKLTRSIAARSGTTRLAVRARPGSQGDQLVVAFPWRRRGRAEALGHALVAVLDGLEHEGVEELIAAAAETVATAPAGDPPDLPAPRIPVVSVTGTNGKTTTTRILAHLCMTAGLRTSWTSSDGVYVDGELIEAGDWSGPGGARLALAAAVDVAVLETARGGLLLRGMGVSANDVSVVTNVSADHLGLQGINTVDQLAEVKAVVTKVTRPTGWAVLNGEDPRVFAMRTGTRARPWVYALSPDSPAIRAALNEGGRAVTVLDGDIVVLWDARSDPEHLLAVQDIPVTLAGLSPHNTANVLAAAAAAAALGLESSSIVEGLRTFVPDVEHNPGRMNLFDLGGVLIVVDFAHNPEGLAALLGVANGLRTPGSAVRLALSAAGDRRDEDIMRLGELAAQRADDVVAVRVERYLRGRTPQEMQDLFAEGAAHVGRGEFADAGGEVLALAALMERAMPGDVVAVMAHAERTQVIEWLTSREARPMDHEALLAHLATRRGPQP